MRAPVHEIGAAAHMLTALSQWNETDEEVEKQRELGRVYAKKSYEKKKEQIDALRSELAALELHYKELLEAQQPRSSLNEREDDTEVEIHDDHQDDDEHDTRGALLFRRYKELALVKERLYAEKEQLQRMNSDWMIVEARHQTTTDESAVPSLLELPMDFVPLAHGEYLKAVHACRDEAALFAARQSRRSSGVKVFEWSDCRSVSGDALEFAFEKLIHGFSALELLDRTWSLLSNPETNCKIYDGSMNATSRLLQTVNKNTLLFYWSMRPRTVPVTFKSLYLLARLPVKGGYMIVFRSIDRERLRWNECGANAAIEAAQDRAHPVDGGAKRSEFWAKFNNWIVVQETMVSDMCSVHFGGSSKASLWEVEVLLMCLRWEYWALGRRLLKNRRG